MGEAQEATSESNQASKSSRNPGSDGSRSGGGGVSAAVLASPPPSSPQIVVNSRESGRPLAEQGVVSTHSTPPRPDVWGVLTAISDKAKARLQGPQILLYDSEHVLGRSVKDPTCQFDSLNVSAKHCTIFRKRIKADESYVPVQGMEPVSMDGWLVYVKDSSSNGTFINCQKLKRDSPEARIKDGDIISLVNAPEHENAFAFLYQEVKPIAQAVSAFQSNGSAAKRKYLFDGEVALDSTSGDSKRVKGLGIGGPDGPVSLDDVRRLQRSNERLILDEKQELRNQLEMHLLTIEKIRAESRAATARHDAEIKELRETLSAAFLDQIQDLRVELSKKEKELEDYSSLCTQQRSQLEDCHRSLAAAIQSRTDADEVIRSQKSNVNELKEQLEEERSQRRVEREKTEVDLRAAMERVRVEAAEELKRQSDSAAQQLREHLEVINKLQEADRENRSVIENLRCKLDDARESLVKVERTNRTLELRLQDEESSLASARKKTADKELELQHAMKELQDEKAAKEKALERLSSVEAQMETTIHDLQMEQQRLQGARERIVLRETQLRAFHSTAEEIARLQQKQQEQLKEMMRALEDGEEESHVPASNQYNVRTAMDKEDHTQTKGGDDDLLQDSQRQSMCNVTVNNEDQKEDAADADSQTTASNSVEHAEPNQLPLEACGDGDTQMDECNGLENGSREAQLILPLDERKGSEPSVPMGMEAGYTQVLDTENNGQYLHGTQEIVNGMDEIGQSRRALVGYTQLLVETQSRSLSAKGLETQLLSNVREDESGPCDGCQDGASREAGRSGGEILLLEHEDHKERGEGNNEEKMSGAEPPHPGIRGGPGNQVDVDRGRIHPTTTGDLLASEVAGSWAYSTAASVHAEWSQRVEAPVNELRPDFDASQVGGHVAKRTQKVARLESSQGSMSAAWHDKERRDLNVMLDIVDPEFSRRHGLDRVMEAALDSEEHTGEEEEGDDDRGSEDSGESEPVSQSVSVSARY